LGGRWYWLPENYELPTKPRWPLGGNVAPGEQIAVTVAVETPPWPGQYRLEWDLVQEQVVWFSEKNGLRPASLVTVTPARDAAGQVVRPAQSMAAALGPLPTAAAPRPPIPPRSVLWPVAVRLFLAHPWIGIGLDNFRLTYGRQLGWPTWDDTIHTNNWYLETLISVGLLGGLPFLAWLGWLLLDVVKVLRRPAVTIWTMAVAAGLLAYLIHGLLDYFLLFNSTGLLFWLLVGLWHTVRGSDFPEGTVGT
ncbi:MAG: O-antigen ligase family protein, partial [Chloroflexota bacterium]